MPTRLIKTLQNFARPAMLTAAIALTLPALADGVKRGELPMIQGVTLIGVEDGHIVYRSGGGENKIPLKEVTGLEIDSVPALATGIKAFDEGQMRNAQKSLEEVWGASRVDWIRHFAGFYLMQVYDKRGEAVSAGQVYAKLAADKSDLFFLSKPPVLSISEADDDQKKRISQEINAVASETKGERRKRLEAFLKLVAGDAATLPEDLRPGPNTGEEQSEGDAEISKLKASSKVILPDDVWDMLKAKKQPKGKWDGIKLLAEGKYAEAVETIKPWLSNPGGLPEMLFIYGRAQLALAEQEDDEDLYRDAGLSFMRIAIHFSRSGQSHPLVAPAKLEAAYVHKKIGREDIYNTLLFGGDAGGGVHLVIDDKKAYPQYRLRYYQIIGETPPADEDE